MTKEQIQDLKEAFKKRLEELKSDPVHRSLNNRKKSNIKSKKDDTRRD